MTLLEGHELLIQDAQQRTLGRMTLETVNGDLLSGTFAPGEAFVAVEQLFKDFEEAVNAQALRTVDSIDAAIAELGLRLTATDGSQSIQVHDVQIWSDGGISCRTGGPAASVNGQAA